MESNIELGKAGTNTGGPVVLVPAQFLSKTDIVVG
jgi:hypothetical protein